MRFITYPHDKWEFLAFLLIILIGGPTFYFFGTEPGIIVTGIMSVLAYIFCFYSEDFAFYMEKRKRERKK